MLPSWYETVQSGELEQGDLLFDLPTPRVVGPVPANGAPTVALSRGHFIVLSQTCDLVNDKVPEVLVASVVPYSEFSQQDGNARSTAFRKSVVQGYDIAFFLLPETGEEPTIPWSLVDFHHLRLVDKRTCHQHAGQVGQRLRLAPPYKEHFSQAFGRYMMRVALPLTAHEFLKVAPAPEPRAN